MTKQLGACQIAVGSTRELGFNEQCHQGDWRTLKVFLPWEWNPETTVIVASPWISGIPGWESDYDDSGFGGLNFIDPPTAFPVPVISNVTNNSFMLHARNSLGFAGAAGLFWLAIDESRDRDLEGGPYADVRYGTSVPDLFPRYFNNQGVVTTTFSYDFPGHSIYFGSAQLSPAVPPMSWPPVEWQNGAPAVFFTPTNSSGASHIAPLVASADDQSGPSGIHYTWFNPDSMDGSANLYYLWIQMVGPGSWERPEDSAKPPLGIMVDSGRTDFAGYDSTGAEWDWQIQFAQPFDSPPMVLITARVDDFATKQRYWDVVRRDIGPDYIDIEDVPPGAVLARALDVDRYGFRIASYNTDCADGYAGFNWLAIGQGQSNP